MLSEKELEELDQALRAASPEPWTAERLDADGHAAMAKYVDGTIRMGGTRYFLVGGQHDDGKPADVCHTGNGPRSEANVHAIAALRNAAPSLISDLRSAREALAEERRRALEEAAQLAEDCIDNGVTVLSAGEVAEAIRGLGPGNADASPPTDSVSESVELREARRLLGEARVELRDYLESSSYRATADTTLARMDAFLGERSSPSSPSLLDPGEQK